RRAKHATELVEARREVGDAHRIALAVGEHGGDDRGVAQILGVAVHHVVEHDVGKTLFLVAGEQAAEQRGARVARKAPPDDARLRIDERGRPSVADDGEVETEISHEARLSSAGASCSSHARTSAGASKWPARPAISRPTENPRPSNSGRMANTVSSVV